MLIGLTGHKGVGKDTAASFLEGYTKLAFADKLKEAVASLFKIDTEYVDFLKTDYCWIEIRHPLSAEAISFSWREFLQRFGTEMGRNTFGENFWIEQWERSYRILNASHVIVTDVRFLNEAVKIHSKGGVIIEIQRPDHGPDGHASEEPLDRGLIDTIVVNDSNLDDFRNRFLAAIVGLEHGVVNGA